MFYINSSKIADSSADKFEFEERSSNANLQNAVLSLVKCIITGPKNTGCFPLTKLINLLFLCNVSVTHIPQRLKVVPMANTKETLSRQQNFSILCTGFSV